MSGLMTARKRVYKARAVAAPAVIHAVYANTLTNMIPNLYAGLNVVSRELVGYIPGVFRNTSAERAAMNQSVIYPVAPKAVLQTLTPGMAVPTPNDQLEGFGSITISNVKKVSFGWNGEEQRGVSAGPGYQSIQADWFAEGLRTLVNAIEQSISDAAIVAGSRAYGTLGTPNFVADTKAPAKLRKILDDNGAPPTGRSLIVDTTIGSDIRSNDKFTKVNESGTTMTLRDGELLNLAGFSIKESGADATSFVAGTNAASATGSRATTTAAGFAKGTTNIPTAAHGTGTLKAGDVITFAGDLNQYVVATGVPDVSVASTALVIMAPGLQKAIPAAATEITTVASTNTRGVAFSQNAIHFVARAPALPAQGDIAMDRTILVDPRSGLAFEVSLYPGYRMVAAEVALAWGVGITKNEHISLLIQ